MSSALLDITDLRVHLSTGSGPVTPVDGVSLSVARGAALGIVGESGSGKSLTLRAILGLLPPGAVVDGTIAWADTARHTSADQTTADQTTADQTTTDQTTTGETITGEAPTFEPLRGNGIAMVFQEPMTALNPTMRVGDLVAEGARNGGELSRSAARARAVELLRAVGIPSPAERATMWPHQLSGGLRQRVMIAAALSTAPSLLLCDEPTTALDVTVQDQILGLLARLRSSLGMALILVTHDLAVVAEVCDRIAVMYAGRIVELGETNDVLTRPRHPYTAALLASAPSFTSDGLEPLQGIGGHPPDPRAFPPGCRFAPRCRFAQDDCRAADHRLVAVDGHASACIHPELLEGPVA